MKTKYIFCTGDNRGCIVDDGSHICRFTYEGADFPKKIFNLYKKYVLQRAGVVATDFLPEKNLLKHEKLTITYPHEWPPALFKDAVLFHLHLLLHLERYGLTLKDALPENILFTGLRPTFVDFFSFLPVTDLVKEDWLQGGCPDGTDLRLQVLERMFVPHMLVPLLFYALGNYREGKRLLEECFCNNIKKTVPSLDAFRSKLLPDMKLWLRAFRKPGEGILRGQIHAIQGLCRAENEVPWAQRLQSLARIIETLDVMPPASGYVSYYSSKGEDAGLNDPGARNEKQNSIATILVDFQPQTVLDIGANTGWFSFLAAHAGAKVLALDTDLSCVDSLYRTARLAFPDSITPLWMCIDDLDKEAFSLNAAGDVQEHPFHMAATKRLCSDAVFCLGLLHHLTLGMGKSFDDVLKTLFALTRKVLVLEFVDMDDPLIQGETDFFPNLGNWDRISYSLEKVIVAASKFGGGNRTLPSTPSSTRHLLVFEK